MFTPEQRRKWLCTAENLRPSLNEKIVFPLRTVEIRRNKTSFQNWEMNALEPVSSIYQKSWGRGDSFILDFGEHVVGYFSATMASEGDVDAPARLELIFGETDAEIADSFDPYNGVLGRGWLQDETINIASFPSQLTPERRYAFRYVKIRIIDTSPSYRVRFADILCRTITSADFTAVESLSPQITAGMRALDDASLRTLANCMHTVFEDGPKRDRRLWLGDLRLQALVNYASFRNYNLVKRCLYLFAGLANEEGIVTACIFETPLPQPGHSYILDYAALFLRTLLEYAQESGDWETALELWPVAERQASLLGDLMDGDGLFSDPGTWWIFIDWHEQLHKQTAMHGVAVSAFDAASKLALVLGQRGKAARFSAFASTMKLAARKRLFCSNRRLFLSGPGSQSSWASQAWMVLAEVVDRDEAARLLRTVMEDPSAIKPSGPYLYHYVVEALLKAGLGDDASLLLQSYWGEMLKHGATTFWEVFDPERPFLSPYKNYLINSYCHAWSCTPAYFIRRYPKIFFERTHPVERTLSLLRQG